MGNADAEQRGERGWMGVSASERGGWARMGWMGGWEGIRGEIGVRARRTERARREGGEWREACDAEARAGRGRMEGCMRGRARDVPWWKGRGRWGTREGRMEVDVAASDHTRIIAVVADEVRGSARTGRRGAARGGGGGRRGAAQTMRRATPHAREKAAAKSDRNRERSKWETTQGAGPQARAKKGREREREREKRERVRERRERKGRKEGRKGKEKTNAIDWELNENTKRVQRREESGRAREKSSIEGKQEGEGGNEELFLVWSKRT